MSQFLWKAKTVAAKQPPERFRAAVAWQTEQRIDRQECHGPDMKRRGHEAAPISGWSGRLLVVFVTDFLEVRIDHVLVLLLGRGLGGSGLTAFLGLRLVHRLTELHRSFGQRLGLGPDLVEIATLKSSLGRGEGRLDRGLVGLRDLVAVFLQRLL